MLGICSMLTDLPWTWLPVLHTLSSTIDFGILYSVLRVHMVPQLMLHILILGNLFNFICCTVWQSVLKMFQQNLLIHAVFPMISQIYLDTVTHFKICPFARLRIWDTHNRLGYTWAATRDAWRIATLRWLLSKRPFDGDVPNWEAAEAPVVQNFGTRKGQEEFWVVFGIWQW